MKLNKLFIFVSCATLAASCSDIDDQEYLGGGLTTEQTQETYNAIPERTEATFSGMFTIMGNPYQNYETHFTSQRPDDFGFVMAAISLDLEGADMTMADNGYNWFSPCGEYTSRNANYANPYIRYVIPYTQLGIANEIIASYPEDTDNEDGINQIAQAKAIRAFDYLSLAPYFQGNYSTSKDLPCIPILDGTHEAANNPRATVGEVYEAILSDLNYAIEHLTTERDDKSRININVAYGLRARAYLNMGEYALAAADAEKAMEGYTPASISDVSVPAFCSRDEANWIWSVNITEEQGQENYATSSSWISAFSGYSYSAGTQNTPMINSMLYNLIPSTDVRKGWWLDENLHSDNIANLSWNGVTGDAIATLEIEDVKEAFLPYTNVKFGMKSGVGSTMNNNDWPLMRVEEMILIQAEGLARSGNESQAREILSNFVRTYRNPSYTIPSNRTLTDEIWFQRRVELWGEGFFVSDARRMGKPIVRFHGTGTTNFPTAYAFNIAADDEWMNLRFPQSEMNTNLGIVDNTGGSQPVAGQNSSLRDGVTD